jgi:MraZ protein
MFLGTFEPNLLDKGRIVLPKKIREELGAGKMILTIGFEQCIFGFTYGTWEEVTKPELTRPLFSDKQGRDLRRKMCAEAQNIELDGQGRCIVPAVMLEFAQIKNELVIIGAGDHFEIWNKSNWQEYRKKLGDNL